MRRTIASGFAQTLWFVSGISMAQEPGLAKLEAQKPVTVKAGRGFVEPRNVRMTGFNHSRTQPLRLVIFYVSDPDTPFLDPIN